MKNKEFYVVRATTSISDWVSLGKWNVEHDPIEYGYVTDYPSLEEAQEDLDRCSGNSHAEILVFSLDKPYELLRRIRRNGDIINC